MNENDRLFAGGILSVTSSEVNLVEFSTMLRIRSHPEV